MPSTLYLDAARMGQMTPSAQWALHDFVRVAGEVGCTLYFERFFKDGFSAWPAKLSNAISGTALVGRHLRAEEDAWRSLSAWRRIRGCCSRADPPI